MTNFFGMVVVGTYENIYAVVDGTWEREHARKFDFFFIEI